MARRPSPRSRTSSRAVSRRLQNAASSLVWEPSALARTRAPGGMSMRSTGTAPKSASRAFGTTSRRALPNRAVPQPRQSARVTASSTCTRGLSMARTRTPIRTGAPERRGVALVREVPGTGEVHRDPGCRGSLDDLGVTNGPPGSDYCPDTGVQQHLEPISEREERVRRRHRAGRAVGTGTGDGQVTGVHPVDLAHAHTDAGARLDEQDGVGLDGADSPPGELQVGQRRVVGRFAAHERPARRIITTGLRATGCTLHDRVDLVASLHQDTATDRAEVNLSTPLHTLRKLQEADRLLALKDLQRLGLVARGDDDLGEHLGDLLRHSRCDDAVGRDRSRYSAGIP